jgi:hypothetical protein
VSYNFSKGVETLQDNASTTEKMKKSAVFAGQFFD